MPVTVLKICKCADDDVEVAGEFATEEEAIEFAQDAYTHDSAHDYEYTIEMPPSQTD